MKNHSKTPAIFHVKRCSVFAFTALLSLTSSAVFAQPDTIKAATSPSHLQEKARAEAKVNSQTSVVNLNNSSAEQLATLKGVGQKRAQAIIAYREQNGAFKSVAEVTQVKGIGEKVLSDNKTRLNI